MKANSSAADSQHSMAKPSTPAKHRNIWTKERPKHRLDITGNDEAMMHQPRMSYQPNPNYTDDFFEEYEKQY